VLDAFAVTTLLLSGVPTQLLSGDIYNNASKCDVVLAIGRDVLNLNDKHAMPYWMEAQYAACPWSAKGLATPKSDGLRRVDFQFSELTDTRAAIRIEILFGYDGQGSSLECRLAKIDNRWVVRQPCRNGDVPVGPPSIP